MRYGPIDPELFIENRRRFRELLPPAALAIFQSNDVLPTNADGTMAFRQNNDLFYLAGVDQEESILLLFPDARLPQYREVLFLKETSEHILIWEGYKLTKDQARAQSGVPTILWLESFPQVLAAVMTRPSTSTSTATSTSGPWWKWKPATPALSSGCGSTTRCTTTAAPRRCCTSCGPSRAWRKSGSCAAPPTSPGRRFGGC